MIRTAIAAPLAFIALICAPAAHADPQILVPGCGEGEAQTGECAPESLDTEGANASKGGLFPGGLIPGAFPGANPGLPPGPMPRNFPVVIALGLTPFDVPINLPLGPTPPVGFPLPN